MQRPGLRPPVADGSFLMVSTDMTGLTGDRKRTQLLL